MNRFAMLLVLLGVFPLLKFPGASAGDLDATQGKAVRHGETATRSDGSTRPRAIPVALQASKRQGMTKALDIPPRLQWDGNFGYCGEVSMISAGLYYGQYVSQYDMRAAANEPGFPQHRRRAQILISMNDAQAAKNMHLKHANWNGTGAENFLVWVRGNIAMGYPVTVGILERESSEPNDGSNYDHIVPVNAVTSAFPLNDGRYHENDEIQFSDNYGGDSADKHDSPESTYQFRYKFKEFLKTRKQLDKSTHEYGLDPERPSFGWVITGVMDEFGETVPVSVKTSKNHETPEIHDGGNLRPDAKSLTLTVTVRGLKPNMNYNLYAYDKLANVPDGSFNANAAKAARKWPIRIKSGDSYVLTEKIQSDNVAVYRAVPATAR